MITGHRITEQDIKLELNEPYDRTDKGINLSRITTRYSQHAEALLVLKMSWMSCL